MRASSQQKISQRNKIIPTGAQLLAEINPVDEKTVERNTVVCITLDPSLRVKGSKREPEV
jgi:hypothetical protein